MKGKQIIINADDFGINKIVTSEIERLISKGCITSSTIMANGDCLDEVRRIANEHPEISYGVHLCLSEFVSLTKSEELFMSGVTDENGIFMKKAIFYLKDYYSKSFVNAIRDELNAQIDVVSSLGVNISHADSHHHVHTIYPLMQVFSEVLEGRGIKKLRLGEDYRSIYTKLHVLQWLKRYRVNKYYQSHFKTTDAFYSYHDFLQKGLNQHSEMCIELMCHPGHPANRFQNEMKLVENKTVNKLIPVDYISYMDL